MRTNLRDSTLCNHQTGSDIDTSHKDGGQADKEYTLSTEATPKARSLQLFLLDQNAPAKRTNNFPSGKQALGFVASADPSKYFSRTQGSIMANGAFGSRLFLAASIMRAAIRLPCAAVTSPCSCANSSHSRSSSL